MRKRNKAAVGAAVVAATTLGLTGVAGAAEAPPDARGRASHVHVVEGGETLSGLAPNVWREVAADNGILNPDLIHPGQRLSLQVLHDPVARWYAAVRANQLDHWFEVVADSQPHPETTSVTDVATRSEQVTDSGPSADEIDRARRWYAAASAGQETAATPPSASTPPPPASSGSGVWDRLAQCESGGDWSINTGNGYYGGLQFSQSSWNAAGGSGNPASASREEQIRVAENLLGMQGWGAWPSCSAQLGLR